MSENNRAQTQKKRAGQEKEPICSLTGNESFVIETPGNTQIIARVGEYSIKQNGDIIQITCTKPIDAIGTVLDASGNSHETIIKIG